MEGGEKMKILKKFNKLTLAVVPTSIPFDLKPTGTTWDTLGTLTLPVIATTLIRLVLVIVALIAFGFLIVGGVKWITSGGDKEATAGAQKTITAALVGLLIVFAAWAIAQLVSVFFGVDILTPTFVGVPRT